MDRKAQKTATDSQIIVDYIESFAEFVCNMNLGRGTERLWKHLRDLDEQMLKRGILTQKQIDHLNV